MGFQPSSESVDTPAVLSRDWTRLAVVVGVAVFFALVGMWLGAKIGWPDVYGVRCSYFKACGWIALRYSGLLLRHGTPYELMFFVWLWIAPATFMSTFAIVLVKRWWKRARSPEGTLSAEAADRA